MTKSELVKAARTTSVRMGDADKLRAQQRQAVGPAAGALESWCPPNPSVPCHLCTGTLTAHAAGCPKAPKAPKARVQRLPAAAAPCGLVMDGDRLDAHRAQCGACQGGKQAASYAGIDRTTAPALLPYYLVASPCGYVGDSANSKESHERVCRWCALTHDKAVPKTAKPAPAPAVKPATPTPITCCRIGTEMALDWPGIGRRPCPFHAGKKLAPAAPPPWVPEIDDWDLLPDA